jgi:Histone acetyl transferase HAT1 N-terminus
VQLPASQASVTRDKGHAPLFTNQMFDDEEILGYSNLKIDIALATDTLVPLLLHSYGSKQSPANDYVAALKKEFPEGLHTSLEDAKAAAVCLPMPSALCVQHDRARADTRDTV